MITRPARPSQGTITKLGLTWKKYDTLQYLYQFYIRVITLQHMPVMCHAALMVQFLSVYNHEVDEAQVVHRWARPLVSLALLHLHISVFLFCRPTSDITASNYRVLFQAHQLVLLRVQVKKQPQRYNVLDLLWHSYR